ncbi:MAG TPA: metal ABC transporter substrate-binding protein [bacterium]|nr:metal ABC transporter substrate-binding protein [bacterium]HQQ38489.1 metal ABC transporter substrate-binding protein [bacterium]
MPKRFIFMGIFALIIAAFAWTAADSWQKKQLAEDTPILDKVQETTVASEASPIIVVSSLFPWYDLSREIGGDRVNAKLILPPGVEAHAFEPTPGDMISISQADLFVYTGDYLEPWAQDILAGLNGNAPESLAIGKDWAELPKAAPEDAGLDPHIWLDPMIMFKAAGRLAQTLAKIDPDNKAYYYERLENYQARLEELDANYRQTLSTCKQQEFIYAGHYAFGYLAARYGLQYQAAQGFSPDAESSPQALSELLKSLKAESADYIFAEELDNPQLAKSLAKDAGVKILMLNSAHNVSKEDLKAGLTYEEIMKNNLKELSLGLKCQ